MLVHWLVPLSEFWFGFNVFKYITFRAALASVTAFLLTCWLAPPVIRWLRALKVGESVRDRAEVRELYDLHEHKSGTPTMGGLLILLGLLGAVALWGDLANGKVWLAIGVTAAMGGIGFWDDWLKLRGRNKKGLSMGKKLLLQAGIVAAFVLILLGDPSWPATLEIPFLKEPAITLGLGYLWFAFLVIAGTSNGVNLTDGLDGLAVGCSAMIGLTLTIMSYLTGHSILAEYLLIPFVPGAGELAVFCAALTGAAIGFLWYNAQPADLFMGDTGSLALGGAIGAVAVLIKKELLLFLIGGVFVIESVSVLLQIASFRLTGRRIFKMAPLHHHFQLLGWAESKVTIRFWILGAVLALLSLSTLKLR